MHEILDHISGLSPDEMITECLRLRLEGGFSTGLNDALDRLATDLMWSPDTEGILNRWECP